MIDTNHKVCCDVILLVLVIYFAPCETLPAVGRFSKCTSDEKFILGKRINFFLWNTKVGIWVYEV